MNGKVNIAIIILLISTSRSQEQKKTSLDDLLKDIFNIENPSYFPSTTQTTILNQDTLSTVVKNDSNRCENNQICVNRILCRNDTNAINTDGTNLIDIRIGPSNRCSNYLQTCCERSQTVPSIAVPKAPVVVECGRRNPNGVGFKITGASQNEAEFGEFPWMVAVLRQEVVSGEVLNLYECGGSLISSTTILTAAHCVRNKQASSLIIRAGEWDTQTKNEIIQHQDRHVKEILVHENFNKGSLHNDIALLLVDSPFIFEENVRPVCLPNHNQNFDFSRCYATGWGKDHFGKTGQYQVILKKIDLPIIPRAHCQAQLRKTRLGDYFLLDDSFICAGGEEGKDTCKGDGGSPLVCPMENDSMRFFQAGIVAYGVGCGTKDVPGVYANVPHLRSWLEKHIQEKQIEIEHIT